MSIIPIPGDIYYERTLNSYFTYRSESERHIIWQKFALSRGYSVDSPPADSPALREDFEIFLGRYKKWAFSTSSLQLGNSIPTDNAYYSLVMGAYFGSLTLVEQTDIWNAFVESQGYTTNPPDTLQIREAFAAFIRVLSTDSVLETLNTYFGTQPVSFRATLWDHFAISKGSSSLSLPDTADNRADFLRFVQRYNALGIRHESLQMNNTVPSTPQVYQNFLDAFFGNLSAIEQKDIWNAFLYTNGYTSNPTDSAAVQQQFARYIQSQQTRLNGMEEASALSPQEMKSRLLINDVLGSLEKFLTATQDLVRLQSYTLMMYGQWQQNYTEMMTRVPNLSGSLGKVSPNVNDLSKFTFGYNKISLREVIRWGIDQAKQTPGQEAVFGNPSPVSVNFFDPRKILLGQYTFMVNNLADGVQELVIRARDDVSGTNNSRTFTITNPTANPPVKLSFDEIVTQAEEKYKEIFTQSPSFISAISDQYGIMGRFTGESTEDIERRAETNALLQQYVENIRARRDAVKNHASTLQTALNQTREGINQQTSLWTAILESIDNIMQHINKRGAGS